jgi:hypothetical protein
MIPEMKCTGETLKNRYDKKRANIQSLQGNRGE